MQFFITWTKIDPIFHLSDPLCNILLSPTLLPKDWNTNQWDVHPSSLLLDSGVYSYSHQNIWDAETVLSSQYSLSYGFKNRSNVFFTHPDVILHKGIDDYETQERIETNLKRAQEYITLFKRLNIDGTPLGVIHGFDEESILLSYLELRDMGFERFGIGSLSRRSEGQRNIVESTLDIVKRLNIKPLHIFGLTIPFYFPNGDFPGSSFDTSTPIKLAYNGTVLYGNPLKRYVINPTTYQIIRNKIFTFRVEIDKPLPCNCPVCSVNTSALSEHTKVSSKLDRAIHNYYQLKWETERLCTIGTGT